MLYKITPMIKSEEIKIEKNRAFGTWFSSSLASSSMNYQIETTVNRHIGCFHVLAIVNSAATNIGVCVSYSTYIKWTMTQP